MMPLDLEALEQQGSAEWWLLKLGAQLGAEIDQLNQLNAYDRGNHPLPQGHERAKETYRRFQTQARTNFVGLVVDAVMDRLRVSGFRMGGQADQGADARAALIWQANQLDSESRLVMRDALVMRRSYVVVGADLDDDANPSGVLVTGESPLQMIHACSPTNRRRVRAAVKTWRDDLDGLTHAVVYLPEAVHYFVRLGEHTTAIWTPGAWSRDETEGDGGVAANPTAPMVPVVPFINRPEKASMGFGEAEDVIDIQNRINQTILDRLVIAAAQSFRQRWATGVSFVDEQGREVQPFDPGADLMWHVKATDAKFGDFAPTDLTPLVNACKVDVEQLASISRTPPYYLLGEMVNISGDALTAADTGATAKADSRQTQFGESWEQVQRLAFRVLGLEAAPDAETIWADAERRNEAAAADAAVKKQSVGVPWRQLMEDLSYSPAQIERMTTDRAEDNLRAMLAAANLGAQAVAQQERIGLTEEDATAPPAGAALNGGR